MRFFSGTSEDENRPAKFVTDHMELLPLFNIYFLTKVRSAFSGTTEKRRNGEKCR
jgi:hypothetical protein